MPPDVADSSSESKYSEEAKDAQDPESESSTDQKDVSGDGDAESLSPKTQRRIQRLLAENKTLKEDLDQKSGIADWYRKYAGEPEEFLELLKLREERLEGSNGDRAETEGDSPPPGEVAAVISALKKEYPELDGLKKDRQERGEVLLDQAQELITELAEEAGVDSEDERLEDLARVTMMRVTSDEKLLRLWNAGDLSAVRKAWKSVAKAWLPESKGKSSNEKEQLRLRRKMKGLPDTSTSGGKGTVSGGRKDDLKGSGLSKKTHERAWDVIEQYKQQEA